MLTEHIIIESAANELAKRLPSLQKYDYNTIDKLMKQVADKHRITVKHYMTCSYINLNAHLMNGLKVN